MTEIIKHLLVETEEMSESMATLLEVIDEITNDGKLRKLLSYDFKIRDVLTENTKFVVDFAKKTGDYSSLSPTDIKALALAYQIDKEMEREDLKIRQVLTENIKFVTDFAKKTGDYSSLSPTDIKVLALAYQIDKEMEEEDHLMTMMTEPTIQRTITVTELPNHTSNPEKKDNANKNEESIKLKETEPSKQPPSDWSMINIRGAEEAKQGADWSAIEFEGSDAVHLDDQNLIGDNFNDQKLAVIADLIKKMDLRDGYDLDHFKPDKYTDDEDSDSDFSDSDYNTDGEHPYYSSDNLADNKEEVHMVEFEDDEAVEEGS